MGASRSPGVCIRSANTQDIPGMLAIYRPIVLSSATSFELEPPDEQTFKERVETLQERDPWLVCEEGGALLGYAYGAPFRARPAYRWSVEVSVYVHAEHRRRGIGRALYTALLGLLGLQGYRTVLAGIALPNEASVRAHEALGFRPVGVFPSVGHKHGGWHDVGFWQLPLAELGSEPPLPVDPELVLSSEAGREVLSRSTLGVRSGRGE